MLQLPCRCHQTANLNCTVGELPRQRRRIQRPSWSLILVSTNAAFWLFLDSFAALTVQIGNELNLAWGCPCDNPDLVVMTMEQLAAEAAAFSRDALVRMSNRL